VGPVPLEALAVAAQAVAAGLEGAGGLAAEVPFFGTAADGEGAAEHLGVELEGREGGKGGGGVRWEGTSGLGACTEAR
jgi:hypothetical protein